MSKENRSKYALLGMLSIAPLSGYDIKKLVKYSIGNFWNENYAQIYPMLKLLEKDGLTSSSVQRQEGRPDRHIYTLTNEGRDALHQWLAEPYEYQVERNELLLKLFFGNIVQTSANMKQVQRCREQWLENLQTYENTEAQLREQEAASEKLPYWLITLSYGKHVARALLDWCDETEAILANLGDAARDKQEV